MTKIEKKQAYSSKYKTRHSESVTPEVTPKLINFSVPIITRLDKL